MMTNFETLAEALRLSNPHLTLNQARIAATAIGDTPEFDDEGRVLTEFGFLKWPDNFGEEDPPDEEHE